jgi:DNA-binding NtrC family response regulator
MNNVWILHRDPRHRAALARLAAVDDRAVLATPGDPKLDNAAPADVVLLGLTGDFEVELQFAHRFAAALRHARVVLLPERSGVERARELFDTLDPVIASYPPDTAALREIVHAPGGRSPREPLPLSQRPARDALAERFGRWFADVELPGLLRILDPQLAGIPVLIAGEPGTGRGLLARYLHAFGGGSSGALVRLICTEDTRPGDLLEQIAAGEPGKPAPPHTTLWLDEVDRLPVASQRCLEGWIEWTLPAGVLRCSELRWLGTTSDPPLLLTPGLQQTLAAFQIRIPPLRDRATRIAGLVEACATGWGSAHLRRPRAFAPDALAALGEYPWPGNLAELEAVVVQSLLAGSSDPIHTGDLRHGAGAFTPIDNDELGAKLVEDLAEDPEDALLETFLEDAPAAPVVVEPKEAVPVEADPEPLAAPEPPEDAGVGLRRLVGAVAHEVRNPLTTIRTFAELFPDQHQDAEFRENFAELVGRGVDRIEGVVNELSALADLATPVIEPVDVAGMLEELLELQRETIHARRLVVLKELDKSRPLALGDGAQLRFAFEAMFRKCLELVPERGDIYFASRHHEAGLRGGPSLRVLVRFHGPGPTRNRNHVSGVSPAENALEFVVAEAVVRAQRGAFATQTGDGDETVLVLDLPAPG